MPWSTIRSAPGSPSRCAMANACTNRDISCTCRFAPLCPGFGGRGRAFSSNEKKPPAGLKEGPWKNAKRAGALSMSHSRWAVSVVKRCVPAVGSSLIVDSAIIRKPPSFYRCRPTAKRRWGKLPMARAAHAVTVADRKGLPSHTASGTIRSGFSARLYPGVEWASSPLDNRISNETTIVARTPLLQFLKALSSDVRLCRALDISVAELMAERLAAPSRRQFVSGAVAIAAGAAVPAAALAAPSKARIAVVGAGIAGLNAALTLQDSGVASTVYEASNRIGGGAG